MSSYVLYTCVLLFFQKDRIGTRPLPTKLLLKNHIKITKYLDKDHSMIECSQYCVILKLLTLFSQSLPIAYDVWLTKHRLCQQNKWIQTYQHQQQATINNNKINKVWQQWKEEEHDDAYKDQVEDVLKDNWCYWNCMGTHRSRDTCNLYRKNLPKYCILLVLHTQKK